MLTKIKKLKTPPKPGGAFFTQIPTYIMQSTHEIPQTQWLFFKAAFGWAFKEGIIAAMPPFPPIWHIGKPYGAFIPNNGSQALSTCPK